MKNSLVKKIFVGLVMVGLITNGVVAFGQNPTSNPEVARVDVSPSPSPSPGCTSENCMTTDEDNRNCMARFCENDTTCKVIGCESVGGVACHGGTDCSCVTNPDCSTVGSECSGGLTCLSGCMCGHGGPQ